MLNLFINPSHALFDSQLVESDVQFQVQLIKDAIANLSVSNRNISYTYFEPEQGEAGTCSIFGQLKEQPYNLAAILNGESRENDQALYALGAVVNYVIESTQAEWFGIYQTRLNAKGERVLVKLAYSGVESRAEFPLTAEFAHLSTNVQVGLTGSSRIINNVEEFVANGGEYYTCDPKVKAEACLPIFNENGDILGITDTEAFNQNFFDEKVIAILLAANIVIAELLPQ
ncbi:GAF domain-containing protein [Flocculibacter collagenilyticus]|uniref:GAF domain-containing protein n=1 Tax=Flocculibacter collagenilyticus TaxID=2744479 RepID=UPI0018F4E227|nr:histidine kinase [Flocculibacter collagenilyticus]